jgi:hypothetical protein
MIMNHVAEIQRLIRCFCSFLLFVLLVLQGNYLQAAPGDLSLSTGYRVDSLDWNIADSDNNPNILSELSWDNLQIIQLGAEAEIVRPVRERVSMVLLGRAAYGWIFSGDNRDSDYGGDNRTLEWSRSENDAGDGHTLDLLGGIGFRFDLKQQGWSLTPQVGYTYFEQGLTMQNGYQTVSEPTLAPPPYIPSPLGPIAGLDSSYLAWWFGPWLGLQAGYRQSDRFEWDFALRWYNVEYRAEADWNLRTDLAHPVSFEHQADGDGYSLSVGADYVIDKRWQVGADLSLHDLQTDAGIVYVYESSGAVGGTRLNEVNWQSWALALSAQYRF